MRVHHIVSASPLASLLVLCGSALLPIATFAATAVVAPVGMAPLPTGMSVGSGTVSSSINGQQMNLQTSPNAVLNWQSFSIGNGYTVNFQQANAQSQVLNRVTGQNPSYILGSLTSNGRVWLLNPNGVLFGQGAHVDVGSLVASTLAMSDADFASGRYVMASSMNAASPGVINNGSITTTYGGQILLLSPNVENNGRLSAPGGKVSMLAANTVELMDTALPYLSFHVPLANGVADNSGSIAARQIDVYGGVVNQSGLLKADTLGVNALGQIVLSASDALTISGTVDTSNSAGKGGAISLQGKTISVLDGALVNASGSSGGGSIISASPDDGPLVADQFNIAHGAQLRADATVNGDGGRIILWSLSDTSVFGAVSARGGASGGDGGFIETSTHRGLTIGTAPDASAPKGNGGTWLIDPYDITITAAGPESGVTSAPGSVTSNADSAVVLVSTIETALNGGTNISIQTGVGPTTQLGDITVQDAITKSAGGEATLTLRAHNNIYINAPITSTSGELNLALLPGYNEPNPLGPQRAVLAAGLDLLGGNLTIDKELHLTSDSASISNAVIDSNAFSGIGAVFIDPYINSSFTNVTLGSAAGSSLVTFVDSSASLTINGGLTLNSTLKLASTRFDFFLPFPLPGFYPDTTLIFAGTGTQQLQGTGKLQVQNGNVFDVDSIVIRDAVIKGDGDSSWSIGSGITVENLGRSLVLNDLVSNAGVIDASGIPVNSEYGYISINGQATPPALFTNTGTIKTSDAFGRADLYSAWTNAGTFDIGDGVIATSASFMTSDIGLVTHTGSGHFELASGAVWNNSGESYDIGAPGNIGTVVFFNPASYFCDGPCVPEPTKPSFSTGSPTLQGGTLFSSDPAYQLIIPEVSTVKFDGVTLGGTGANEGLTTVVQGALFITGGLTLNGELQLSTSYNIDGDTPPFPNTGHLEFDSVDPGTSQMLTGTGTILTKDFGGSETSSAIITTANIDVCGVGCTSLPGIPLQIGSGITIDSQTAPGLQLQNLSQNSGTLKATSGTLTISGVAPATGSPEVGWTSSGTIESNGGNVQTYGLSSNSGTIHAASNTISLGNNPGQTAGFSNQGTITIDSAGTLEVRKDFTNAAAGMVEGSGIIDAVDLGIASATVYSVLNQGTFTPLGTLTLQGNYQQDSSGVLQINAASASSYGVLAVTDKTDPTPDGPSGGGVATLAGALQLDFTGGYLPGANVSFTPLVYGSHTGTFATIATTPVQPNLTSVYRATELEITPAPSNTTFGMQQTILTNLDKGPTYSLPGLMLDKPKLPLVVDNSNNGNKFLLTDGDITIFKPLPVATLGRDGIKPLLAARVDLKNTVFADAIEALEQDPALADLPPCISLLEAEKGDCIMTSDLQKTARAKPTTRSKQAKRTQATIPNIVQKRALVIGLNDYRDKRIPQLTSALPDSREITNQLQSQLGYEVTALENPSKATIARWLNRFSLEMDANDSLVIYFAGHGELVDKTGLGYWIPADATSRNPRGWISNSDISRWLALFESKQVAMILDSCYSGTFAGRDGMGHDVAQNDVADPYLDKRTVVVMTSGSDEPVADSGANGHSVFAYSLIQQLRGLEKWKPGSNVFTAIRTDVERELPQSPQYGAAVKAGNQSGGDFLFERRKLIQ